MCLLTFFPPDTMPNVDALSNGTYVNDDGHGFAIVAGDRIIVQRGLNAERMVEDFARIRRAHQSGPALFHSRMSTHGNISKANCHPFRLGGDSRTVLAHNGILPKAVQPRKGDPRSDTRIAAEDFLPRLPFGSLGSRRGRDRLARWLTRYNKLVFLTVNPRYQANAYIVNEDCGIWDGEIWYSNTDYQTREPGEYWQWWDEATETVCNVCCEYGTIDTVTRFCRTCGACDDCGSLNGYCVCYVPGKLAQSTHLV